MLDKFHSPRRAPPTDILTGASLFLDFDGTLVALAATPDMVRVDRRLRRLIEALASALDGRLAIISGRSIDDVCALCGTKPAVIAGSHGLEFLLPDGCRITPQRPGNLDYILGAMRGFAGERPGTLVEEKPYGAALHYRGAPHFEAEGHALARGLADETGMYLQTGKMMVELRMGDGDKGSALRRLMEHPPMAGHRPVFIGDDDTDEPAMAAATALGGCGILVGDDRATQALYRIPSVPATLTWLESACEAAS